MNCSLVGVDFGVGVLGHERISKLFCGFSVVNFSKFW